MSNEPLTRSEVIEIVREQARSVAEIVLGEHTIPAFPAYFMNTHWLVTYEWLAYERNTLTQCMNDLERRIAKLERPWWRRWFH
jgi:hypothetical protein